MKKLLILGTFAFTSVFAMNLSGFTTTKSANQTEYTPGCTYGQCSASKSNGERCRNCCQEGSSVCWSHR